MSDNLRVEKATGSEKLTVIICTFKFHNLIGTARDTGRTFIIVTQDNNALCLIRGSSFASAAKCFTALFLVVLMKRERPFCMPHERWTAEEKRSSLLFPSWTSVAFVLAFSYVLHQR